jgi:hypothetical protein
MTKTKGKMKATERHIVPGSRSSGSYKYYVDFDVDLYHVSADTYSELITAIDGIADENLTWYSKLGPVTEGMPHKSKGRWKAALRGPRKGKGRRI